MGTKTDQFPGFVDYSHFHDINDHTSLVGMNLRGSFGTDPAADDHLPTTTFLWH